LTLNFDKIKHGSRYVYGDARITSGHELLHIMQTLYDPRGRMRKTFSHSNWLWMMEASATWFERAIADTAALVPQTAVDNWDFPFRNALELPPGYVDGSGARRHGYGAAAFLQHLVPAEQGSAPAEVGSVLKLIADVNPIGAGFAPSPARTPVQALREVFGGYSELKQIWYQFADRYVRGEIWGGFPTKDVVLNGASPATKVTLTKTSPRVVSTVSMPELSARHWLIRFDPDNPPDLSEDAVLKFRLTDPARGAKAFLYSIGADGFMSMTEFTGVLELEDAAAMARSGESLYVMAANGHNTYRGGVTSNVTLEITAGEPFTGIQNLSGQADMSLYNREYQIKVEYSISSDQEFQIIQEGQYGGFGFVKVSLRAQPLNPDQPDQVQSVNIRYKISNFRHDFKFDPATYPGAEVRLFHWTSQNPALVDALSGEATLTFPLGAIRARTFEVDVRPFLVLKDNNRINLTGGGDMALVVDIGP
jgi:hypothetical protein